MTILVRSMIAVHHSTHTTVNHNLWKNTTGNAHRMLYVSKIAPRMQSLVKVHEIRNFTVNLGIRKQLTYLYICLQLIITVIRDIFEQGTRQL